MIGLCEAKEKGLKNPDCFISELLDVHVPPTRLTIACNDIPR